MFYKNREMLLSLSYILALGCVHSKELNTTSLTHFIDCVTSLDTSFDYAVSSDGVLLLQPSEIGSKVSDEDEDHTFACLSYAGYPVELMVFKAQGSDDFKNGKPLTSSSVPDLIMSDIHPYEISQSSVELSKRKNVLWPFLELYDMYLDSEGGDCSNADFNSYEPDTCHSFMSHYKSVEAKTTFKGKDLAIYLYPHHDCSGDQRRIQIPEGGSTGCIKRTTYSFYGVFIDPPPPIICLPPLFNCIVGGKNVKKVANYTDPVESRS